jgi:pSer/pThr/pTyr-binding forkhead associated (FHA) protein
MLSPQFVAKVRPFVELLHMPAMLVPIESGNPITLDKPIVLVGRHPDCDAVILNSRKISRKHCAVALVNNNFVVRDLGSMNGVWVNGDRVEQQASVSFGDELMIGDVRFRLETDKLGAGKSKPRSDKAPAPVVPAKPYADVRPPINRALVTPPTPEISGEFPVPIDDDDDERFAVPPSPDNELGMDMDGDDFIPLKKS